MIKWFKIVERKSTPLTTFTNIEGNDRIKNIMGREFSIDNLKVESIRDNIRVFIDLGEADKFTKIAVHKGNVFLWDMAKKMYIASDDLTQTAERIGQMNLDDQNDENLLKVFLDYIEKFSNLASFLHLPHYFEKFLTDNLNEKIKRNFPNAIENELQKYFLILTTVQKESTVFKEQKGLLEIAILKQKISLQEFEKRLEEHAKLFGWMGSGISFLENPWDKNLVLKMVKETKNPEEGLRKFLEDRESEITTYRNFIKTLPDEIVKEAELLQEFMFLRSYRMDALRKAQVFIRPLLFEIAKRLEMTYEDLVWLTAPEIEHLLKSGTISQRKKGYVILRLDEKTQLHIKENEENVKEENIAILHGNTANKGYAEGHVKVIREVADLEKVNDGDILVASMTTPDMTIAMKKTSAIVTDEGGILCHAAIVSRELNIPCIVGTKIATKILKDDDLVKVDADKGIVKKI